MRYRYRKLSTAVRLTDGRTVFVARGELLPPDTDPVFVQRLLARGSLDEVDDAATPVQAPEAEEVSAAGEDTDDLVAWLRSEQPNVADTVAAAEGDPDRAAALLAAEREVTDGHPRKGVERGLLEVIDT